jgi:hypothetical protein
MQLAKQIEIMKTLIVISLLLSATVASCQLHWEKATDWVIYRYQGHQLFKIPLDSLNHFDTLELNHDSMTAFLTSVQVLHPETPIAWMGGYIATCKLNGSVRKVELSNYGGFFYDEKTKTYYKIASERSEDWVSFLEQCYLNLTRRGPTSK